MLPFFFQKMRTTTLTSRKRFVDTVPWRNHAWSMRSQCEKKMASGVEPLNASGGALSAGAGALQLDSVPNVNSVRETEESSGR
jgi:hypothetical protein